ncbi:MAG TPA: STAS/SEC14 domain-containing protein [Bryobacteraceae bacterium]|jgi:hypothetical protein|nr:STAS/SEC14 domain-containing protein [Bryobacteraceae bacterium]
MPIECHEESGGKILDVYLTGKLVKADYGPFVSEFERLLGQRGKLRVLFDMTGFEGWDAGAIWADLKFDARHYSDIVRLAVVGDSEWHHSLAIIFRPFTKARVKYFEESEAAAARAWLNEA